MADVYDGHGNKTEMSIRDVMQRLPNEADVHIVDAAGNVVTDGGFTVGDLRLMVLAVRAAGVMNLPAPDRITRNEHGLTVVWEGRGLGGSDMVMFVDVELIEEDNTSNVSDDAIVADAIRRGRAAGSDAN